MFNAKDEISRSEYAAVAQAIHDRLDQRADHQLAERALMALLQWAYLCGENDAWKTVSGMPDGSTRKEVATMIGLDIQRDGYTSSIALRLFNEHLAADENLTKDGTT